MNHATGEPTRFSGLNGVTAFDLLGNWVTKIVFENGTVLVERQELVVATKNYTTPYPAGTRLVLQAMEINRGQKAELQGQERDIIIASLAKAGTFEPVSRGRVPVTELYAAIVAGEIRVGGVSTF